MIPLRILLQGFLCYREKTEINFDDSSLWMLAGLNGIIIGVPILLLSIPCYFGMRLAERLVGTDEEPAVDET